MRFLRSMFLLFTVCVSCVDEFYPKVNSDALNLLVVDGYIDLNGTAQVKLTRSITMQTTGFVPTEINAQILIKSSTGESFDLIEFDPGIYTASGLHVNDTTSYSLFVKTTDGKEYQSDQVKIYATPDVENVYFEVAPNNEQLFVMTESKDDNSRSPGYYLVDCVETWAYHAQVLSDYKLVNQQPVKRTEAEQVYYCWRDALTPTTLVNTTNLTKNFISKHRVATIDRYSQKIQMRYSALVTQRAISEEEYLFRQQLIKGNEQLGSLFDVTPGPTVSNIHSLSNSSEYVLGYFRGQQLKEKRFFIELQDLPKRFLAQKQMQCQPETTCPMVEGPAYVSTCIPLNILSANSKIVGLNLDNQLNLLSVNFVKAECGDCTAFGGTNVKPPFW